MITFIQFLREGQNYDYLLRRNRAAVARRLISTVLHSFPKLKEIGRPGSGFNISGVYQLRLAPTTLGTVIDVEDTLNKLKEIVKRLEPRAENVSILANAINSERFKSVTLKIEDTIYEIILAKGGTRGDQYEREIIDSLITIHKNDKIATNAHDAAELLDALQSIDPRIQVDNIKSISPRKTGKITHRLNVSSAEEAGPIIADATITLNDDTAIYLSLKSVRGSVMASFGAGGIFSNALQANTDSPQWKRLIAPLGFDPRQLEAGLRVYDTNKKLDFDPIIKVSELPSNALINLIKLLIGANYILVRRTASGFRVRHVTQQTVDDIFLKELRIIERRYPRNNSKQASITLVSSTGSKFVIELRNSAKGLVPNKLILSIYPR